MIGSGTESVRYLTEESRSCDWLWLKRAFNLPTEPVLTLPFCAELRVIQIVTALVSCWWCVCVTAESSPLLKWGVSPDMIRLSLSLLLSFTQARKSVIASALGLNKTTEILFCVLNFTITNIFSVNLHTRNTDSRFINSSDVLVRLEMLTTALLLFCLCEHVRGN